MHLIFKHASEVIVWLDIPDQDSDLAFDLMDDIHQCLQTDEFLESELLASTKHLLLVEKLSSWIALQRLLSRPWWSRPWTLQELLLSRQATFYCGVKSAPWPVVDLAIRVAGATQSIVQDLVRTNRSHESWIKDSQLPYEWPAIYFVFATGTYATWHEKGLMDTNQMPSSRAVLYFLRTSQTRLCLLPEDKVYSILGLVPPEVYSEVPKTDYGQRTVQQVYMQMVRAYVQGTRNLDVICLSHYTNNQDPALPSWTPDWRRNERVLPFINLSSVKTSVREWHHSFIQKQRKYLPVFSHDCKTITVSGTLVGTIKRTEVEDEILPHRTREFEKEENHTASGHFASGWKLRDMFPRLLTESEVICEDEDMKLEEYTAHLLLGILSRINTESSRLAQEESEQTTALGKLSTLPRKWDIDQVSESAETISMYRTAAETEELDLCLVPHWAKPGDVVYQFVGCSIPVVLRRLHQKCFTFIGDCYVYRKPPRKMVGLLEQVMQEGMELERLVLF